MAAFSFPFLPEFNFRLAQFFDETHRNERALMPRISQGLARQEGERTEIVLAFDPELALKRTAERQPHKSNARAAKAK
ncbi:MAG TPA: hypothetical protein VK619_10855 [Pyrinomonadaceae bacterium]|nr:hypothetical protein [Pyrinomonadaceae bacterium]